MEIDSQIIDNIGVIAFDGKMLGEPADSKRFESHLKDLINKRVSHIVLDLERVHRINSTGLAILITATTLASQQGEAKVSLVGANDFIQGALTLTRLHQFFNFHNSLDEARASLTATL